MTSIETNPCTREIQVEIPAEVVANETETIVQKYQKHARIPGFRRGKVPATIIRQRFAEDLRSEVVETLFPRYFRQETEKQGLMPVSPPRFTDMQIQEGQPLRFKATFEVLPEIEVSGYKEVQAEKKDTSVSEEEVAKALESIREQHASYNPVEEDRPLADGDFAQASFNGRAKDDADAKPVNVEEVLVEIGGSNTVHEFSDNLRGLKVGEQKSFEVTYSADHGEQRLAGKTLTYEVTVKGIKQKQMPELNDEFAKQVGDFETLDTLTEFIRKSIAEDKQHHADNEAKDKILEELVAKHDFPVPEALVEHQIDLRLERGLRALAHQGMRTEDLKKLDMGRLRAAQRDNALKEVRATLLLDRIAKLENIEVSEEEVTKELEALAKQSKQGLEDLRARLTQEMALDKIRDRIREAKTLDFLYRQSA